MQFAVGEGSRLALLLRRLPTLCGFRRLGKRGYETEAFLDPKHKASRLRESFHDPLRSK
jgi:hypothetical protein